MGMLNWATMRTLLAAALALATTAAAAADPVAAATPPAPAKPVVAADAQAVLDRMTAYLKGLARFSITTRETRDEVIEFGYKLQRQQVSTMVVQRPDRLRVEVDGDLKRRSYVYDGRTLSIHAPDHGVYAQVDAPPSLDLLLNGLLNRGVEMPLIDMLLQAVQGNLAAEVQDGRLVGSSRIEGVAVDHLAFRQASIDWQLWVEQGARPLPRKLVITTRYEVGDPQYAVVLDWNLDPAIEPGTFAFVPPPGSRRISFQGDASGGQP